MQYGVICLRHQVLCQQVQAVAWEVKKQVAQYIFVDTGSIKSLITLLAASEQAPERRVAVDMLHVSQSKPYRNPNSNPKP